jgi:shikimate dehydrogenase
MANITDFIGNTVDLAKTERYAAILGESPSKGAKSPSLWNAAFKELGLSGFMHPMDVLPAKLEGLVNQLRTDDRFIGGAVTMPYKIDIMPFLDEIEEEARSIGAVNCLYRKEGKLWGANTDGAGGVWSLQHAYAGSLEGKTALLVGAGGAGFAVAAYLAKALGPKGALLLANRTIGPARELAGRLSACATEVLDWTVKPEDAARASLLVNCTGVGFETLKSDDSGAYSLRPFTPLGPVDTDLRVPQREDALRQYLAKAANVAGANVARSLEVLAAMDSPFVFDIIYQPRRTMLLHLAETLGYQTLNGVAMNLEQAVIAFDKACAAANLHSPDAAAVREIMAKVW